MEKYIIRTSDRALFKKCRRQWDYQSKIRHFYEPVIVPENLEFGTAIHAGLEEWYRNYDFQPYPRTQSMQVAFLAENNKQRKAHGDNIDLMLEEQYHQRETLGLGMLRYFGDWAPRHEADWEPVLIEHEFEVPVLVPVGVRVFPTGFDLVSWSDDKGGGVYQLTYKGIPVVYQGRIDLLVRIDGELWIVDHKTTAQFKDTWPELDVDTQVTSYAWAAQFYIDEPIAGVIFQQLRKAYPQAPRVLKSGKLSKDKSQPTTYKHYMKAIQDYGLDASDYTEFLAYLSQQDDYQYVRRIQLHRSQGELDSQSTFIFEEALDMLGGPGIYPNPTWANCPFCPYKAPCLMDNDYPGEQRGLEMLASSPDFHQENK